MKDPHDLPAYGWREWVALPDLGVPAIKCKLDTGAKTSAIHAYNLETYSKGGQTRARFEIHPVQFEDDIVIPCDIPVVERRTVSDSGGHREKRCVIRTRLELDNRSWTIDITLTNRDSMRFRMLLGRSAMNNKLVVHPAASYLAGQKLQRAYPTRPRKRKHS